MDLPEEARAYAAAKFPNVMESVTSRLFALANEHVKTPTPKMVDLGTGPGTIPIMIAKAQPTWHITAVDAAKAMTRIAQISTKMAMLEDRVKIHLADAKATGLPDHSFDIVFCNSLLHHMPDPIPLWKEIKRIAAYGGLIFVRDLRRPTSEAEARRLVTLHASQESELLQEEFYRSLLSAFGVDEVRQQLAAARLSQLQVAEHDDRYLDVWGVI